MEFLSGVTYEDADGDSHAVDELPMWKAERVVVSFTCPICSAEREDAFAAPLDVDERTYCGTCERSYFIRRPSNRNEDVELGVLIDEQLVSVSVASPIVRENKELSLLLATRVQTVLFSGLAVGAGVMGSVYAAITLFNAGGITTKLGVLGLLAAGTVGSAGVIVGGLRSFIRAYLYHRRRQEAASFAAFIKHVGRYYHEKPFRLT